MEEPEQQQCCTVQTVMCYSMLIFKFYGRDKYKKHVVTLELLRIWWKLKHVYLSQGGKEESGQQETLKVVKVWLKHAL